MPLEPLRATWRDTFNEEPPKSRTPLLFRVDAEVGITGARYVPDRLQANRLRPADPGHLPPLLGLGHHMDPGARSPWSAEGQAPDSVEVVVQHLGCRLPGDPDAVLDGLRKWMPPQILASPTSLVSSLTVSKCRAPNPVRLGIVRSMRRVPRNAASASPPAGVMHEWALGYSGWFGVPARRCIQVGSATVASLPSVSPRGSR